MRTIVESIRTDFRYALRLFRKAPFSTASILLVLAFGLGLHIAVSAFYRTFFLAPVPGVEAPERLAAVAGRGSLGAGRLPISYFDYRELAATSRTLAPTAAYRDISVSLSLGESPSKVVGQMVTPGFFEVLGVRPVLGRTLRPEGEKHGEDPYVVVLSYYLWKTSFGGDPRVVGRKVLINQAPFTIVGVIDRKFVGIGLSAPRLWVPLSAYRAVFPEPDLFFKGDSRTLLLVARLRRGATLQQARMELGVMARHLEQESPAEGKRDMVLSPLTTRIAADRQVSLRRSTVLLLLLSAVFLLIACGNVANLLLVRGLARQQEIRIRYQLGASRSRLAQQFLIESLALSLVGGLLALLVAASLLKLLVVLEPPFLPGLAQESLLGRGEYGFALAAALAVSIVFGLVPAFQACRSRFLMDRGTTGMPSGVSRGALFRGRCSIAFQAFLCTVSLACTGFFVTSLLQLGKIDPGFERKDLLMVSLDLKTSGYGESEGRQLQHELLRMLGGFSNIRAAALAGGQPMGGFGIWRDVSLAPSASRTDKTLIASEIVSPDYFRCVGIPILRGRSFDTGDQAGSLPVVIINETAGRLFWPGRDPLGLHLYLDDEPVPVQVVGIARDARYVRLGEASAPLVYLASTQRHLSRAFLHVRFAGSGRDAVAAVRDTLTRLGRVHLEEIQTISQLIDRSLWLPRLEVALLSIVSLLALALAITGMAGVTSFFLQQRRQDFGIRAALGATPGEIFRSAVGRELTVAVGGAVAGVAAAWLIHLRIAGALFEPENQGLQVAAWAAALTLSAALLSTGLPVLRWSRSEPALRLRT
jgi:predicted permease